MKKWMWMMAVMLAGSLALTGCSSDSDDDDDAADAAEPPAAAPAAEAEDDAPSANEQLAGITPSGLALTEKFSIVGRGMVYQVRCDAVAGADKPVVSTFLAAEGIPDVLAVRDGAGNPVRGSVPSSAQGDRVR